MKKTKLYRFWLVLILLTILLNIIAFSQSFCDWYKATVYGVISDVMGRAMAVFPVAIGELIMYLGILLVPVTLIILLLLIVLRKKQRYRCFAVGYFKVLVTALLVILFSYTITWVIPFRGTVMKVKGARKKNYSLEFVQMVRNDVVNKMNACAEEVERDENGSIIYSREAMEKGVIQAMHECADDYPLLYGYYPPIKDAICSDFLEWMWIGGYTYPYTMEITWNKYCDNLYFPALFAHESAHHQGYYQENEANFIEFLACTTSDDPLIRYAGYYAIKSYIDDAYMNTLFDLFEFQDAMQIYHDQPQPSRRVHKDLTEAYEESKEKYESESHPAKSLAPTASQVADVGWKVQGEILQENSYDGVVEMLLQYYDSMKSENNLSRR